MLRALCTHPGTHHRANGLLPGRALAVGMVLLALPLITRAEEPKETVIRLTVPPMAAPQPALEYQLLPTVAELQPGNPVPGYLKCFMEQNNFFFSKQSVEDREKWLKMPLKDLPARDLRHYGGYTL